MGEIKNIKWKSEIPNGIDWVTVKPSSGDGDTNATIIVTNSKRYVNPNDLQTTVAFMCIGCEEPQKTINVCRCACNCDSLTEVVQKVTTIDEKGLVPDTVIGTYKLLERCDGSLVTATIDGSPLKCESGAIKTINAIEPSLQEKSYIVNIYFDKDNNPAVCRYFTMSQEAVKCTCDSITIEEKTTECDCNSITIEEKQ